LAKCEVETEVALWQKEVMKTVTIEYPDQLHEQLRKLVEAGWFKTPEEGVVEALRRYLSGHSVELQEKQIMADVEWGLKGCPSPENRK
jgi:Arc/MetJ-type ribon-helix-helix transcriptional regulator